MWRKHPGFNGTGITLISSLWPDTVPPNLDAAYENVEKNVLFFKGKKMHFQVCNEKNGFTQVGSGCEYIVT